MDAPNPEITKGPSPSLSTKDALSAKLMKGTIKQKPPGAVDPNDLEARLAALPKMKPGSRDERDFTTLIDRIAEFRVLQRELIGGHEENREDLAHLSKVIDDITALGVSPDQKRHDIVEIVAGIFLAVMESEGTCILSHSWSVHDSTLLVDAPADVLAADDFLDKFQIVDLRGEDGFDALARAISLFRLCERWAWAARGTPNELQRAMRLEVVRARIQALLHDPNSTLPRSVSWTADLFHLIQAAEGAVKPDIINSLNDP
ncbi:hypothetical protein NMY22_g16108 [Coprinellus aureogranulatus]|nr:hypothetical protein NMY22_g16108 [Coprinellus aureogranulatus]